MENGGGGPFLKRQNQTMLQGPLLKNVILYTVPIILTSWLQLLFNAADLVVVGQANGSNSLAAVGATGAITNLIINLFIGLSVGAGVGVAHGLGSGDDESVHRTVHTAIPAAIVSGIFLTIVGVALSETFLVWMDTPTENDVLKLATLYMQIYFGGMVFNMVYNFAASILRAAGDTKSPLIFLGLSGLINVGLNMIFVLACGMNVEGVALATVISQAVSAVLVVITLMRRTDACKLELKKMRFYGPQLRKMIGIGLPAGIQGSMFSISNVMIQSSINSFGDIVMSGNTAAGNIEGFVFTAMNAFHQTAVNFTGQNVGARQYDRVRKILWTCLACVGVTGLVLGLGMYAFGPQLLSIYITDSQEAIQYGLVRLGYICAVYFLCGLMDVSTGALRGMGSSIIPMIISVLGVCGVRLLWIGTVFQIYHTTDCLYLSYGVSWVITFAAQFISFWMVYKKHTKRAESL
jgi:putative MATE family efflux protein